MYSILSLCLSVCLPASMSVSDHLKTKQTVPDMANIVLLLLIVMFIFALLGVTFFGEKNAKYFGDLPTGEMTNTYHSSLYSSKASHSSVALFTLFICITQDGWMQIFRELEVSRNSQRYLTVNCLGNPVYTLLTARGTVRSGSNLLNYVHHDRSICIRQPCSSSRGH